MRRALKARLEVAALLVVLAVVPQFYVWGLGYYVDDWEFLKMAVLDADGRFLSALGAYADYSMLAVRPLQILWLTAFNVFAPGNATAAHLANQVVFALACLVLYRALRNVPGLREAAFPFLLIYCCMPHFVTTRLWFANHQANLALLFFALAVYAMARLKRSTRRARPLQFAIAAASVASALAYELFAFTLVAAPAFIWTADGERLRALLRNHRFRAALLAALAGVVLAVLYKLPANYGLSSLSMNRGFTYFVMRAGYLYADAAVVSFWVFGAYIPVVAAGVLGGAFFEPVALAAAGLVLAAAGAAVCLRRARPGNAADTPAPKPGPGFFLAAGLIGFALGYLPYLSNFYLGDDPFGTANRGHIASALGTALTFYAAYLAVRRHGRSFARIALVLFCATGIFLQVSIARTWVTGWSEQQELFAELARAVKPLEKGDVVLLYGACPFNGAAPVFLWYWALTPRLQLAAGHEEVTGDVIVPGTQVRPQGMVMIDPDEPDAYRTYPYGAIRVFNSARSEVTRLGSFEEAKAYFARNPVEGSNGCDFDLWGSQPMYEDPLPVLEWLRSLAETYGSRI